ncbi:MAG: metallo-beta-lactamase [Verrucomicrobiaceae bacterium]|nr:metallo-beta-lactamase [Verrucomicrobiaceae bacterium]
MKIKFCGAAGTTTGSQHLIEVNGQRILLDCGLYQGHRNDAFVRNQHFPFDPSKIDVVVLSHAHIDHSGNLPNLVKQGFRGNIFSTGATRDLCSIMLPDCAHIQESDINWLNKKRKRDNLPLLEVSYTLADAEATLLQFITVGYKRPLIIADGVKLTFVDAGHMIGSAQVVLNITDRETGKQQRLLFSGDVGRPNNDLLNDPEPVENVDILLMESTYGGRKHELPAHTSDQICGIIRQAIERHGKIIIPSFAVERTQQLLYTLDRLRSEGCFPQVPTFVDSPLAVNATNIFRLHTENLKPAVRDALFMKKDPFGFDGLEMVRSVEDSMKVNSLHGPAIIISASGMAESGRILHHLRNNIENPNNTVLFVGYCAQNTLGWKIREGWKQVPILGASYDVNARIEILDSFSGHADHDELLGYFKHTTGPKHHVFLVHGEPDHALALQSALQPLHTTGEVKVAKLLDEVTL